MVRRIPRSSVRCSSGKSRLRQCHKRRASEPRWRQALHSAAIRTRTRTAPELLLTRIELGLFSRRASPRWCAGWQGGRPHKGTGRSHQLADPLPRDGDTARRRCPSPIGLLHERPKLGQLVAVELPKHGPDLRAAALRQSVVALTLPEGPPARAARPRPACPCREAPAAL